jgi:hypothetical protein
MAKKKTSEASAATGTGTGTGTETKPKTKVKEVVTVHTGLLKLMKDEIAAEEKTASILVQIAELVARDNISNPVLVKTIVEARGVAEITARSQASRIRNLMKDKDTFEALKAGRVTVRAAVKSTSARRVPSKESTTKKFDSTLANFVQAAKATGQDKKTILTTVESQLEKAGIK